MFCYIKHTLIFTIYIYVYIHFTLVFTIYTYVIERAVYKHDFNHLRENIYFTVHQSDFLPHDFCKAIDHGKEIRVMFGDVSKTFDRVWHRRLVLNVHAVGISSSLLNNVFV